MTALVAAPALAGEAILFYLVAYAAVNLGAFGVIAALAQGRPRAARRSPTWPASPSAGPRSPRRSPCSWSRSPGIPITAGFVGKFYLFNAAVASGWVVLAIVGVLMSVVSAYYYLRRRGGDVHGRAGRRGPLGRLSPSAALALASRPASRCSSASGRRRC